MSQGQNASGSDGYLTPVPQNRGGPVYSAGSTVSSIYPEPYQPLSFGQGDSVYEDIEN